ncbi:MAG: hypothetical protein AB1Z19_00825, partial [Eubacteriales bacterium]
WYYLMIFAVLVITAVGALALFMAFRGLRRSEENKKAIKFIKHTAMLGSVSLIAALLAAYSAPEMLTVAAVFAVPLVLAYLYIIFEKNQHRDYDLLFLGLAVTVPLMVFAGTFLAKLALSGTVLLAVRLGLAGGTALLLFLIFQTRLSKQKNKIIIAFIPLLFTPILQMAGLEALNIINKRFNVALNIQYEMYLAIMLAAILLGAFLWIKTKKTKQSAKVYKLYLPIAVLILGLILAQPARVKGISGSIFEYANFGISIDHLFQYGSIPIIETFDAHMLSSQFFGYFTQLFNGYELWSAGLYNGYYIAVYYLLAFSLFKRLLDETTAFVFVLGFPFLRMLMPPMFIMAVLMVIALDKLVKEDTAKNRIWFAIVCAVLCLYGLDVGVAAFVGGALAYTLVFIKRGEGRRIFSLFITGVFTILAFGVMYLAICFIKDIPPLARLKEMLAVAGSSQNWAYFASGDKTSFVYNLVYFIMPLSMVAVVLTFAFQYFSSKDKGNYSKPAIAIFLFFVIFYFVNLPRGIIRHSLIEEMTWYIAGTYFPALLALSAVKKEGTIRIVGFSVVILGFFLGLGISYPTLSGQVDIPQMSLGRYNLVANVQSATHYQNQYTPAEAMNGERVVGEEDPEIVTFTEILDTVLVKDQTYVDLASLNYMYAITGRKNPNYVNQMPAMLNGDTMQKMAIREIEAADAPIAILPNAKSEAYGFGTDIDGVATDYKYYLMFEYVYENYRPLIRLDGFDVYARNDVWSNYAGMLTGEYTIMTGSDKAEERILGYAPLLWAKDAGSAFDGLLDISQEVDEKTPYMESLTASGAPANLVLEITAASDTFATVILQVDGQDVGSFNFFIKTGTHRYAVRLSADNNYWESGTRAWRLEMKAAVTLTGYAVLDDKGNALTD